MRHTIIIAMLAVASMTAFAQTRYDATMTVDSVEREFIVVRPSGAVPPGGYPMVFMFHGTSGDGEKFYNISGWKEKGEQEKFVTVFPSSLRYCFLDDSGKPGMTTKWNDGEAQEVKCPQTYLKDDIHFVRAMVDTISQLLPIDHSRIYASGFSNGGGFVSKLSVEMSDVFAAIAAVAGPLHSSDSASPRRHIPVAFAFGTLDDRYYTPIGLPEIPFNDSCLFYFAGLIRRYLGAFNLSETFTKDSTALSLTYLFNTPASAAPSSPQFTFTLLNDMTHEYPNGSNYPITAANVFWQFFSRFTGPLSVDAATSSREQVTLYPNPASSFLVVRSDGEFTLTLRTLLGEAVFTTTSAGGERIALPRLARGIYIADISTGRKHTATTIYIR
jgi:polyhydroxybutyrate depolymerase